ncbi:hypothetical protein HBA92_13680 [Ochrobactrum sp. MR28]|nr:hypothetical protein [Ochrobactrum sp. MR28]MBX8817209.1 hypothetical protein [Ochrobactrum sp. MR31]
MDYIFLSVLLSALLALSGCNNEPSPVTKSVATDDVNLVKISGDASLIRLTTQDDQTMQAIMTAKPSGWLSGWFYNDCKAKGDMVVTGQTLLITSRNSDWYDLSECSTDLQINLPRNASVMIDQPAFKADLQGGNSPVWISTPELRILLCQAQPKRLKSVALLFVQDCNLMILRDRNRLISPVVRLIQACNFRKVLRSAIVFMPRHPCSTVNYRTHLMQSLKF